jgi:MraZ protein
MIGFLGEYEVTFDAKGRFLLPAAFKKQLGGDTASQFVINRGAEKCLTLWPKASWDPVFTKVSMLNDFDPKVRKFRHLFLNGASPVEIDTAGRLLIPKALLDYAGVEKDAILVTAVDKLEIWDKVKYKEFIESILSQPEAYSDISEEVMVKQQQQLPPQSREI